MIDICHVPQVQNYTNKPSCITGPFTIGVTDQWETALATGSSSSGMRVLGTTGSATSRPAAPRRVRFATDDSGRILEQVCPIASRLSAGKLNADLYWSNKDYAMFRRRANLQSQGYRITFPDRIYGLEAAFCSLANKDLSSDEFCLHFIALHRWAATNGRGLEHASTRLLRRSQRQVVRDTILYYQGLLQLNSGGNESGADHHYTTIQQALGRFSFEQSRQARDFALMMALSDAQAIRG